MDEIGVSLVCLRQHEIKYGVFEWKSCATVGVLWWNGHSTVCRRGDELKMGPN